MTSPTDRIAAGRPSRGQTTLDFLVGTVLFLTVVGFVFLFVPRLLAPFDSGAELPLVANRVADQLVGYHLADPSREAALNATCAGWFFNGSTGDPCPAFDNSRPLHERLGVAEDYDVNVTVEGNATGDADLEVLCLNGTRVRDCSGGGTRLATGPRPPPDYDSVVVARRVVSVGGRSAHLVVRVW